MLTKEELSKLPDLAEAERVEVVQSDGSLVRYRRPVLFSAEGARQMTGESPLLFADDSGSWEVVYYLEGGPYKRRFSGV